MPHWWPGDDWIDPPDDGGLDDFPDGDEDRTCNG
jgi:hypothetical protein